jgi:O-acetyl-ADP-ribose deacetylase (regulator of RNase III)
MKIRYVHGDLLRAEERFIVHGCNAQGVMGSGVAALLRRKDERVYTEYRKTYEAQGNRLFLGQTIWVRSTDAPYTYIDGITQEFFGRDPDVVYCDYEAIAKVMQTIDRYAVVFPAWEINAVAMPLLGAGLANGSWKIISEIIEANSNHFEPVVYLLDGKIPE